MTSTEPYAEQSTWKDVRARPQDDGPVAVVPIVYSAEYVDAMDYLRAVSAVGEISQRALDLTGHVVELNQSLYTVWEYRKRLLLGLHQDLRQELLLLDRLLVEHPKNYQMWHHREIVITELADTSGERDFLQTILKDDAKNYHTWAYRQWLVRHFSMWDGELDFINDMLAQDVRNNSAWNYRYFYYVCSPEKIMPGTDEKIDTEIQFVLDKIKLSPSNESSWQYLQGLHRAVARSLADSPFVVQFCEELVEKQCQSRHLFSFLVDLYTANKQIPKASDLCLHLAEVIDPIRKKYWTMRYDGFKKLNDN